MLNGKKELVNAIENLEGKIQKIKDANKNIFNEKLQFILNSIEETNQQEREHLTFAYKNRPLLDGYKELLSLMPGSDTGPDKDAYIDLEEVTKVLNRISYSLNSDHLDYNFEMTAQTDYNLSPFVMKVNKSKILGQKFDTIFASLTKNNAYCELIALSKELENKKEEEKKLDLEIAANRTKENFASTTKGLLDKVVSVINEVVFLKNNRTFMSLVEKFINEQENYSRGEIKIDSLLEVIKSQKFYFMMRDNLNYDVAAKTIDKIKNIFLEYNNIQQQQPAPQQQQPAPQQQQPAPQQQQPAPQQQQPAPQQQQPAPQQQQPAPQQQQPAPQQQQPAPQQQQPAPQQQQPAPQQQQPAPQQQQPAPQQQQPAPQQQQPAPQQQQPAPQQQQPAPQQQQPAPQQQQPAPQQQQPAPQQQQPAPQQQQPAPQQQQPAPQQQQPAPQQQQPAPQQQQPAPQHRKEQRNIFEARPKTAAAIMSTAATASTLAAACVLVPFVIGALAVTGALALAVTIGLPVLCGLLGAALIGAVGYGIHKLATKPKDSMVFGGDLIQNSNSLPTAANNLSFNNP